MNWKNKFHSFSNAFSRFEDAVLEYGDKEEDYFKESIIKRFEFTHELAWKMIKDFLDEAGEKELFGSKNVTRKAVALELIEDVDTWLEMIETRNISVHAYRNLLLEEEFYDIRDRYYPLLKKLYVDFSKRE
jgi:nucleotidyltransferase substrate binding protein (TIGR01987 family)